MPGTGRRSKSPTILGATAAVGVLLGIGASEHPIWIVALTVGAFATLCLHEGALAGLLLVGAWPAYLLPAQYVALATVLLGLALAARLAFSGGRRAWRSVRAGGAWTELAAVGAFFAVAAVSSLPLSTLSLSRLVLFASVCVPCFVAGRIIDRRALVRGAFWMGLGLLAVVVLRSGDVGYVNPIALGQAAAVTALAGALVLPSAFLRVAIVAASFGVVVSTGKIGPAVAIAAGGLYTALASGRRRGGGRTKATRVLVTTGVVLSAVLLLTQSYNAARRELIDHDPSVQSRIAAAKFALGNTQAVGAGADALGSTQLDGRFSVRYAHNFFLDGLVVGGLIGVLPIVLLTAWAVRRAARNPDPLLGPFVAVVVAALFSGGVLENWAMWLALGVLLGDGGYRHVREDAPVEAACG